MKIYLFDKIEITDAGVKFVAFRNPTLREDFWGAIHHIIARNQKFTTHPESFDEFTCLLKKTKFSKQFKDYEIFDVQNNQHLTFEGLIKYFASQQYNSGNVVTNETLKKFYKTSYDIRYIEQKIYEELEKEPTEFIE